MTFFVVGALPGDVVMAHVTKLKKTYGYAKVVKILNHRKTELSSVPVSDRCGGCSLMNFSYRAQLRMKRR
ncbi:MAG: hypothetical protein FRC54_00355 [bacterium LCO1.1]|uniref:TRAM domain-containing protein n=1 Tax=Candidatus Weimeria bifida TaxID=2599074 RepID=A0A6N7IXV0_9FIRM|nr:hypothetical protein [Candidatus Weimeria bifida]